MVQFTTKLLVNSMTEYNQQKSQAQGLRTTLLSLLFVLVLTQPLLAATTIKVGIYNNSPAVFLDENQQPAGFFIDILENIAKEEDWELQYQHGSFLEMLTLLKKGEITLMPAVAYSTEREKFFNYADTTLFANWASLYSRNNLEITSLTDLEGKKIVVKQGDIHFLALKEMLGDFYVSCRFLETDDYETALEFIDHKAADIAVVGKLYGNRMKKKFSIKATPIILNPVEIRFAASKSFPQEMLQILDNHLQKMKNSEGSVYYWALNKWFTTERSNKLPPWLITALYSTAGCILLLIIIIAIFKQQLNKRTRELKTLNTNLQAEIQERKSIEEDLRKIARMVDASQNAMALIDRDYQHIFINHTYKKLFCEAAETSSLVSLKQLVANDFFTATLLPLIKRCLAGEVLQLVTPAWIKQEKESWWNITFSPYYDQQGNITGFVASIHDFTERMELENKLKMKQKMEAVGLLAGGVAHDLNNILSGIVSYPDMLLLNRDKDDPLTKPLTTIKKSGERAAMIVQDMLTMSRRGSRSLTPINLNTIIRDFLESLEYKKIISQENITINTHLAENLNNSLGSEAHLSKIIMNLFINAIEAIKDDGSITITSSNTTLLKKYKGFEIIPAGDYVTVSITDTGSGMTETEKNRLFEPFYSTKVLGRSGSGLGLSIVWACMKDHNGFIDIQTAINEFTRFTLYFPITTELKIKKEKLDIETIHGNKEMILLVDDLEEQRELGKEILTTLGYSVTLASSGEEAVELCKSNDYRLLILDMIMPGGIDGLETYKQILQIKSEQKAIIASGFANNDKIREAINLGVSSYIQKPFSIMEMAITIHNELQSDNTATPQE